jgi:hypothetical protein
MAVAQSPFRRTVNAAGSPSVQACPRWSWFVNERRSWWGAAAADGRATRPAGLLPTNAAVMSPGRVPPGAKRGAEAGVTSSAAAGPVQRDQDERPAATGGTAAPVATP